MTPQASAVITGKQQDALLGLNVTAQLIQKSSSLSSANSVRPLSPGHRLFNKVCLLMRICWDKAIGYFADTPVMAAGGSSAQQSPFAKWMMRWSGKSCAPLNYSNSLPTSRRQSVVWLFCRVCGRRKAAARNLEFIHQNVFHGRRSGLCQRLTA